MNKKVPTIVTDRLLLREINETDAENIYTYLSDDEVMKYYGLAPFQTLDETLEEINWYRSIFTEKKGIRWGITFKNSDTIIGSCGFHDWVHPHFRAEMGFELSKQFWRQGIMKEALAAITQHAFQQMDIKRIQALVEPENMASQKLLETVGFLNEGLLRSYEFTRGKFDDLYMFSLLERDL